jgi:hypothetical protein
MEYANSLEHGFFLGEKSGSRKKNNILLYEGDGA